MNSNPDDQTESCIRSETSTQPIDPTTFSYLRGQISFQDYESLLETQKILSVNEPVSDTEIIHTTVSASNSLSLLQTYTAGISRQHSSHSSSSATSSVRSQSVNKIYKQKAVTDDCVKPKFKDRFLNLKNIFSSNEDTDGTEDEDNERRAKASSQDGEEASSNEEDEDCIENFDETSNWNDFDIETLNFDKFIKDHQQTSKSGDEEEKKKLAKTSGGGSSSGLKQSNSFKRKLDAEETNELKAKRRVKIIVSLGSYSKLIKIQRKKGV